MRAVVCTKLGSSFEEGIANLASTIIPIPAPKAHEVQIKVAVVSLNFMETLIIQGKYQQAFSPPFILGSEFSGVVTKLGRKVRSGVQIGDRVAGFCRTGAHCEYAIADPAKLWVIPDSMSMDDAAAFPCVYGTAYMSLVQRCKLSTVNAPSKTVLITAASGGIGTACAQIASALHCKRIIGCVGTEAKKQIARDCGCHQVINYREHAQWHRILKKQKTKLDVVCDAVGGDAFNQAMKCMNWYGKVLVIGFAGGAIQRIKANRILLKSIDVCGIAWGATFATDLASYRSSVADALTLYESGQLKPVIGRVYSMDLAGVTQAYRDLSSRKSVGKLLLRMDGGSDGNSPRPRKSRL